MSEVESQVNLDCTVHSECYHVRSSLCFTTVLVLSAQSKIWRHTFEERGASGGTLTATFRSGQDTEARECPKTRTLYCSIYQCPNGLIEIVLALLFNGSPDGLRGHLLVIQTILCCHQLPSLSQQEI